MAIHAEVEGIGTLEFPDGTDPKVIQETVKKQISGLGKPEIAAPSQTGKAPDSLSGTIRGVADVGVEMASGAARQIAGIPKDLATLAGSITAPLSRMTPEQKAKEAKINEQPGITEKLQDLLTTHTPVSPEGQYLLDKLKTILAVPSAIASDIGKASEATIGKPATAVLSDVVALGGIKGAGSASKAGEAISKATSTESKVQSLMKDLAGGKSVGVGETGTAVKGAITKTSEAAKKEGTTAYEELDKAMPAGTSVKVAESTKVSAHHAAGLVVDPKVKAVADKLASVDSMTFDSLKTLRTQVSDMIGTDRNVNRQLKSIRDAISKDIENRASELGPEAKKAWDTANAKWVAYTKGQDAINKVLTRNWQGKTPTEIYRKVLLAAKTDPEKIKTVMGSIKDPSVRKQFAASVLHQMSDKEGVFNGDKLVREWGNMDPSARKALFDSVGGTYESDMSSLVDKLERIRQGHTGLVKEVSGVGVAAILAHLIPGGTKVVGGITLIREGYKFSPATVEKLLKTPQAVKELAAMGLTGAKKTTGAVTVGSQQMNRIGDLPQKDQPARVGDVQ